MQSTKFSQTTTIERLFSQCQFDFVAIRQNQFRLVVKTSKWFAIVVLPKRFSRSQTNQISRFLREIATNNLDEFQSAIVDLNRPDKPKKQKFVAIDLNQWAIIPKSTLSFDYRPLSDSSPIQIVLDQFYAFSCDILTAFPKPAAEKISRFNGFFSIANRQFRFNIIMRTPPFYRDNVIYKPISLKPIPNLRDFFAISVDDINSFIDENESVWGQPNPSLFLQATKFKFLTIDFISKNFPPQIAKEFSFSYPIQSWRSNDDFSFIVQFRSDDFETFKLACSALNFQLDQIQNILR